MQSPRNPNQAPRSRDVLGVPRLPPGRATVAVNRLRALHGRVHASAAPPPLRIMESLFGMLDHRVLVALCEAGGPDALHHPTSITDLADQLKVDPAMLHRLCVFADTHGWLRLDRKGRVCPTRVTEFLHNDHPGGWRAWVDFAGGAEVVAAVQALSLSANVPDAFCAVNGSSFFEWMRTHTDRWATFDRAMAAGGRMHALGLSAALDWRASGSVCDVGGGTGDLLAALLDLHPHLRGQVLDLPEVVTRCDRHDRMEATSGDAFESVPTGHDTYLLVNVLHDWGDAEATRILSNVAAAVHVGGRVIVVDTDPAQARTSRVAAATDVLMAALTPGGHERTTDEFIALGAAAGLRHDRTVRLASADLAHCFLGGA